MLQAYSLNVEAAAGAAYPLTSVRLQKGQSVVINGTSTIQFNKCGVYMLECDASAAAAITIQAMQNGVLLPFAQSTGTSPSFMTLIQVSDNNTQCPCSSPTTVQIVNSGTAPATATNLNVVVTKIC